MPTAIKACIATEIVQHLLKAESEIHIASLLEKLKKLYPAVSFSFTPENGLHVILPPGGQIPRAISHSANRIVERVKGDSRVIVHKSRWPEPEPPLISWWSRLREKQT
jgi:hypothetical protein